MGTTYKKPSQFSAARTLQRFFANRLDSNTITKAEMLASWGRDKPEFEDKNEGWLSGKLTAVYAHGLARPHYTFNPWRKLEYIELTPKGKVALNRDDAPVIANSSFGSPAPITVVDPGVLSMEDILAAVPKINAKLTTHRLRVIIEEVDRE